jgi:hypothetical protein
VVEGETMSDELERKALEYIAGNQLESLEQVDHFGVRCFVAGHASRQAEVEGNLWKAYEEWACSCNLPEATCVFHERLPDAIERMKATGEENPTLQKFLAAEYIERCIVAQECQTEIDALKEKIDGARNLLNNSGSHQLGSKILAILDSPAEPRASVALDEKTRVVKLSPKTHGEIAEHFAKVTKAIEWPSDGEPQPPDGGRG